MSAYVIANVRVKDSVAYQEYIRMVPATIEHFGGRYLARGGLSQVMEGDLAPGRVIILEFPSYEDALGWYSSDDYAAAKGIRERCADGELILVNGVERGA